MSPLEEQGLIQAFEYNFELAWNVIKDYYYSQGETDIQGSRDAFRLAFKRGLVKEVMENTGISKQTRKIIQDTFTEYPEIDKVILYGSRAKGNYQHGSDIDITLYGNDITLAVLNNLSIALDDLLLPYTFDISIYEHIDNKALIQHIESFGKIFYIKNRD